jgi:hypothetical protein
MAEEEYFVRRPDSDTARGPLGAEKLRSLAEAGQLDRDWLLFDPATETWKSLGENAALCAQVFPERRKLTLRRRTEGAPDAPAPEPAPGKPQSVEKDSSRKDEPAAKEPPAKEPVRGEEPAPEKAEAPAKRIPVERAPQEPQAKADPKPGLSGVGVNELLQAAGGRTEEMEDIRTHKEWTERAIALASPLMGAAVLVSSIGLLATAREGIFAGLKDGLGRNDLVLLTDPLLVFGLVDLILGLALLLGTALYGLLRLRLALGLGYLGWMAFAAQMAGGGHLGEIAALFAFSAGLAVCTFTTRFLWMLLAGIAALAGATYLGLFWNLPNLLT